MFRIGGNTFYARKNKIPMKIPEFKRSGIGLIVEFRGIPNGFPNQDSYVKNLRVLVFPMDQEIHLLCVGWRIFCSSCAVVSVFWFPARNRSWYFLLMYLECNTVVALC